MPLQRGTVGCPISVMVPSAPGSRGIDGDAELLQELGLVC